MDRDAQLRLSLLNVYGEPLRENVSVALRNQNLTGHQVASAKASKRILIKDLCGAPLGLYRIDIDSQSYLPVSQFVNLKASGSADLEVTFPINLKKVKGVAFLAYQELPDDLRVLLENSNNVFSSEGEIDFGHTHISGHTNTRVLGIDKAR